MAGNNFTMSIIALSKSMYHDKRVILAKKNQFLRACLQGERVTLASGLQHSNISSFFLAGLPG